MTAPRKRGRRVALILGVCGAAVLALAVLLFWRPLLVEYHLLRLKVDPERVWAIEELRDGSARAEALDAFLRSRGGREWLAEQIWEHVVAGSSSLPTKGDVPPTAGYYFDRGDSWANFLWSGGEFHLSTGGFRLNTPYKRGVCFRLMCRATLRRVPVPSEPEWLVSVRETHEDEPLASFNGGKETVYPPGNVHRICIVERAASAP